MINTFEPGQKVKLIILRETDLGFVAEINACAEGLLYHNEIFEKLVPGDSVPGYIKKIRPNGSIDLQLQSFGSSSSIELGERIIEVLNENGGQLAINDKSSAEKIYELFGISKKKYKMALGGLYKKRLITISDDGIKLALKK